MNRLFAIQIDYCLGSKDGIVYSYKQVVTCCDSFEGAINVALHHLYTNVGSTSVRIDHISEIKPADVADKLQDIVESWEQGFKELDEDDVDYVEKAFKMLKGFASM